MGATRLHPGGSPPLQVEAGVDGRPGCAAPPRGGGRSDPGGSTAPGQPQRPGGAVARPVRPHRDRHTRARMHLDVPLQIPPLCFSQAWHHRYDVDGVHQWLRRCVRETVAQRSPTDPIHKLILDPVPNPQRTRRPGTRTSPAMHRAWSDGDPAHQPRRPHQRMAAHRHDGHRPHPHQSVDMIIGTGQPTLIRRPLLPCSGWRSAATDRPLWTSRTLGCPRPARSPAHPRGRNTAGEP
jgi:hypothetical protein